VPQASGPRRMRWRQSGTSLHGRHTHRGCIGRVPSARVRDLSCRKLLTSVHCPTGARRSDDGQRDRGKTDLSDDIASSVSCASTFGERWGAVADRFCYRGTGRRTYRETLIKDCRFCKDLSHAR
jgi:hypothetical protein